MASKKEDAEKLSKEVEAVKKEMEIVLAPYNRKLQEIKDKIKNISDPFYDKVEKLEQEYLDKYLVDCNGKTITVGNKEWALFPEDLKEYTVKDVKNEIL